MTRTPLSRSNIKGQLVADVLNSQHAGTAPPPGEKYEDILNLQGMRHIWRLPAQLVLISTVVTVFTAKVGEHNFCVIIITTRICAAEMAVRYAALCACRKVHYYVTLAHKRKPKFFYFGCSLVRRCNCKQSTPAHGTDGQTDRVRRIMRPPPREKGRIIK